METTASGWAARLRARGVITLLVFVVVLVLVPLVAFFGPVRPGPVLGQTEVEEDASALVEGAPSATGAEVPSYGAGRPGPVRGDRGRAVAPKEVDDDDPVPAIGAAPVDDDRAAPEGVVPVAIQIDKLGVDAYVETAQIDQTGTMADPSGPWVVAWYRDLAAIGEGTNVVLSGHVDYWTTEGGEAVFSEMKPDRIGIAEGDVIEVYDENDEVYEYQVVSNKVFNMDEDMTAEVIRDEIVGPTEDETLTIITCGGDFNYETGEYYSRRVIRAVPL